jgi:hypothetical protein
VLRGKARLLTNGWSRAVRQQLLCAGESWRLTRVLKGAVADARDSELGAPPSECGPNHIYMAIVCTSNASDLGDGRATSSDDGHKIRGIVLGSPAPRTVELLTQSTIMGGSRAVCDGCWRCHLAGSNRGLKATLGETARASMHHGSSATDHPIWDR